MATVVVMYRVIIVLGKRQCIVSPWYINFRGIFRIFFFSSLPCFDRVCLCRQSMHRVACTIGTRQQERQVGDYPKPQRKNRKHPSLACGGLSVLAALRVEKATEHARVLAGINVTERLSKSVHLGLVQPQLRKYQSTPNIIQIWLRIKIIVKF